MLLIATTALIAEWLRTPVTGANAKLRWVCNLLLICIQKQVHNYIYHIGLWVGFE